MSSWILLAAAVVLTPAPAPAPQVSDTFGDEHVRTLIERARATRGSMAEGLTSFDARIWERFYAGLDGFTFRRERGIIDQERVGQIRWTADGDRIVHWEAAHREHAIVGWSSGALDEEALDAFARGLTTDGLPPPLESFDPDSDRLFLGGADDWFLHPLADSAGAHYRFESGDTLRISLPTENRTITLAEARVLPRERDFRSLSASLWFDLESGAMVRAIYRPARPFDLELDVDEDLPPMLPSVHFEIPVVSIDYSLHEFEWWIPQRFTFEGEARVGRFARFPMLVEWVVTETEVNAEEPPDLIPDVLPDGWHMADQTPSPDSVPDSVPDSGRVIVVARSGPELIEGAGLRHPDFGERIAFSGDEFEEFERRLRQMTPQFGPVWSVEWGLADGLTRFNRVEGLASGVRGQVSVPGRGTLTAEARLGVPSALPTAEISFEPEVGRWLTRVAGYHRLVPSADFDNPHSLSTSINVLALGGGPNPFHFASGVEAVRAFRAPGHDLDVRLFGEWHSEAERGTHFHVRRMFSSERTLPEVLPAAEGLVAGLALEHRWHTDPGPDRARLSFRTGLEAAGGDFEYGRLRGSAAVSTPLVGRLAGALEVGGGRTLGDPPPQRLFFPGGADGFRGGRPGDRAGEGFVLVRGELAQGVDGARLVLFGDLLRMDGVPEAPPPPLRPAYDDWEVAAGGGVSFLDGLVRFELVRSIRPDDGWSVLSYFDALF